MTTASETLKGVVLAGGAGTRLFPLTKVTNKHLLPVGRYPMIYHPLMRMRRAGIEQVAIVTSPEHMGDVVNLLGSGRTFGLDLTYRVQDEPGGIFCWKADHPSFTSLYGRFPALR